MSELTCAAPGPHGGEVARVTVPAMGTFVHRNLCADCDARWVAIRRLPETEPADFDAAEWAGFDGTLRSGGDEVTAHQVHNALLKATR